MPLLEEMGIIEKEETYEGYMDLDEAMDKLYEDLKSIIDEHNKNIRRGLQ